MKKIVSMLWAVCLCIVLIGCGESKTPSAPATDEPAAEESAPAADDAAPAEEKSSDESSAE